MCFDLRWGATLCRLSIAILIAFWLSIIMSSTLYDLRDDLESVTPEAMRTAFEVNTIAPLMIAKVWRLNMFVFKRSCCCSKAKLCIFVICFVIFRRFCRCCAKLPKATASTAAHRVSSTSPLYWAAWEMNQLEALLHLMRMVTVQARFVEPRLKHC